MIYIARQGAKRSGVDRREWMLQMAALGLLSKFSVGADSTKEWKPQFFSVEQNETLVALGERIIPGSAEALCNRLVDFVMPIESGQNQRDFLASLDAFDREAQSRHRQRFAKLNTTAQDEILSRASAQGAPLHRDFQLVKEWMADAYWSSQKGFAELGSTGRMAWSEFPGCPQAQVHN